MGCLEQATESPLDLRHAFLVARHALAEPSGAIDDIPQRVHAGTQIVPIGLALLTLDAHFFQIALTWNLVAKSDSLIVSPQLDVQSSLRRERRPLDS